MATDKQKLLISDFLSALPKDEADVFRVIIDYLLTLKYNPVKCKTSGFGLDFYNSKLKQKIAKFYSGDFRLKFYAANLENCSEKFVNGVKRVIEDFDGRYTGCYGCGRCKGELRGYTYIYLDGRKVFRCGSELIEIASLTKHDIPEVKELIKAQNEFFIKESEL